MTIPIDYSPEPYVDVSKLLYQLANARVILERLPEDLEWKLLTEKYFDFRNEIENFEDTETDYNDDEGETVLDLEQDVTDAQLNDDSTESDDNELQYRIISTDFDGSKKLRRAYCKKCKQWDNSNFTKKCLTCNETFRKFECGRCNAQYFHSSMINSHIYKCQPAKVFQCRLCDYQCKFKYIMLEHLRRKHEKEELSNCSNSERIDFQRLSTSEHMLLRDRRHSIQPQSEVISELQYRIISTNLDGSKKLRRAYCKKCKQWDNNNSTKKCLTCNEAFRKFECGRCNTQFFNFSMMNWHIYKCQPVKLFQCRVCDYQCNYISRILNHLKIHEAPTDCPHCGQSDFDNEGVRSDHILFCKSRCGLQPQLEDQEKSIFEGTLYQITKVHQEDDMRKKTLIAHCYNCNESFPGSIPRSCTCAKCNKKYRMYQCGKCLIQYSNRSSLIDHVYYKCVPYEIYSCRKCDYQCHRRSTMLKHLEVHKNPSECPNSGKQFTDNKGSSSHNKLCRRNSTFQINIKQSDDIVKSGVNVSLAEVEEADYRVICTDVDETKRKCLLAYCYDCDDQEIVADSSSKCSRCNKNHETFRCGKCQAEFKQFNSLKKHVHFKCLPHETFYCKKCDYQCHQKRLIISHLSYHANATSCPECQKQFAYVDYKKALNHIAKCRYQSRLRVNVEHSNEDIDKLTYAQLAEDTDTDYRVVHNNVDDMMRKYLLAYCYDCDEQETAAYSNSKCSKCNKNHESFRCDKCQAKFSEFRALRIHAYLKCMPAETFYCKKCDYQCHMMYQIISHVNHFHAKLSNS